MKKIYLILFLVMISIICSFVVKAEIKTTVWNDSFNNISTGHDNTWQYYTTDSDAYSDIFYSSPYSISGESASSGGFWISRYINSTQKNMTRNFSVSIMFYMNESYTHGSYYLQLSNGDIDYCGYDTCIWMGIQKYTATTYRNNLTYNCLNGTNDNTFINTGVELRNKTWYNFTIDVYPNLTQFSLNGSVVGSCTKGNISYSDVSDVHIAKEATDGLPVSLLLNQIFFDNLEVYTGSETSTTYLTELSLVSPSNNTINNTNHWNFTYTLNINSSINVTNCSWFTNITSNWLNNKSNQTLIINGTNLFEVNISSDTNYSIWNVYCTLNDSSVIYGTSNYSFSIPDLVPNISLISPLNNSVGVSTSTQLKVNVSDGQILNVSFYWANATFIGSNTTDPSGYWNEVSIPVNVDDDSYIYWLVNVSDGKNTVQSANYTFSTYDWINVTNGTTNQIIGESLVLTNANGSLQNKRNILLNNTDTNTSHTINYQYYYPYLSDGTSFSAVSNSTTDLYYYSNSTVTNTTNSNYQNITYNSSSGNYTERYVYINITDAISGAYKMDYSRGNIIGCWDINAVNGNSTNLTLGDGNTINSSLLTFGLNNFTFHQCANDRVSVTGTGSTLFYIELDKFNIKKVNTVTVNYQDSNYANFTSASISANQTDNTTIYFNIKNAVSTVSSQTTSSTYIEYINITNNINNTNNVSENTITLKGLNDYSESAENSPSSFSYYSGGSWVSLSLSKLTLSDEDIDGKVDTYSFLVEQNLTNLLQYRIVAPLRTTTTTTVSGGGSSSECSTTKECQDKYNIFYICKSSKCIINQSFIDIGQCNFDAVCDIERGETIFNCPCDAFLGCGKKVDGSGDCIKRSISENAVDLSDSKVLVALSIIFVLSITFIIAINKKQHILRVIRRK